MPIEGHIDARRGWRTVLVLVHVAFMAMNVSALVSTVWQRTHLELIRFRGGLVHDWRMTSDQIYAVAFMDMWGTFGRLSLLAVGIYLTALIARGDRRVPRYYIGYGVALVAFDAILRRTQVELWDIPRGTAHASDVPYLAAHAAAMAGWVVYLSRSKRVRATFVHDPGAVGAMGRLLLGLGALALLAWPFVLNMLVDATVVVAGHISPREVTAGEGFAQGIMAMSAATGLFVLMKHAFRLRNVWMAVLLPVCFAALAFLFEMQSFTLHWTF
jgi:hypothetical protein